MDLIYLDNAATSFPKPEETYRFMDGFYRTHGVNPGRSGFDLCMETGQMVDDTRKQLCRFFHGTDPDRLVFSYNSTDALNLALFGLLEEGDHAVTTTVEHNAVLRPLYHLATRQVVERPQHGVVLHGRGHRVVAFLEQPEQREVQRVGGVVREDQAVRI